LAQVVLDLYIGIRTAQPQRIANSGQKRHIGGDGDDLGPSRRDDQRQRAALAAAGHGDAAVVHFWAPQQHIDGAPDVTVGAAIDVAPWVLDAGGHVAGETGGDVAVTAVMSARAYLQRRITEFCPGAWDRRNRAVAGRQQQTGAGAAPARQAEPREDARVAET